MNSNPESGSSMKQVWVGRAVTGLMAGLLILDAFGKVAELAPVVEGTARLGYPTQLVVVIGLIELLCALAYLIPQTSLVGAVLLTGYLGGAVATHLRLQDPLWTHTFSPIYVGVLVWGGLLLRDNRLRAFVPFRNEAMVRGARSEGALAG